jgi:colanic acid/amylovoran biosynthesis protein
LNDSFKQLAFAKLETLELAKEAGAVTALVGQGIGPMADGALHRRAAQVLQKVDFIALRDGVSSLALLRSMGISEDRLTVTGDDAVGVAYQARRTELGSAIGVNLRLAEYAEVGPDLASCVGAVVRDAAVHYGAPLLALPISRFGSEDDWVTARLVLDDAPTAKALRNPPTTPAELLRLLPECRVVVAGSYHAAVLALSMGIPAVAIAGSDYYVHKFRGLADQFGASCRVERTDRSDFRERLAESIAIAWQSAPAERGALLTAAMRQIAASEAAYQKVRELVEARLQRA